MITIIKLYLYSENEQSDQLKLTKLKSQSFQWILFFLVNEFH